MPRVEKSALVSRSAAQMFELVNDVESYPQFLPWCRSGKLLKRDEHELCGEIEVARAGIRQVFSTCNRLYPYERIDLRLRSGPFRRLEGSWRFTELREDACKVSLEMEFEFAGRLINAAFGTVFSQIADNLVDAFCKRAREMADE
ncbi:MAG: type II toxin-antitoxin system RatA family toxin [Gammaproteobacteria bacterium]